MLTEPPIDKKLIIVQIEMEYGLHITHITFIQGGECSWDYKIETETNVSYFLKMYTQLEAFDIRCDLMYKLFNDCAIKNIPYPIKTQGGKVAVYIDIYPASLFTFISGTVVAERKLDNAQRFSLGELVGRIHKAKETIGDFEIKEDFAYTNKHRLLHNIEHADSLQNNTSDYIKETARLLLENKNKIIDKIEQLVYAGNQLKAQHLDFVICHGEPHNWNIMLNDEGRIFLIDWDDAVFAPKEKDLAAIKDDSVALEGYKSIVGETELNSEVVAFYSMKWNISEIEDWSSRIFAREDNDIQNRHYVNEFKKELACI